ncbi:family 20 glycosylhydrolase [Streptomyces sp. H27-D2]|uniref:family 20 glycosylhydrolase n=1 Tax=Streptomyces sp. H27-D2 TaxID=3046304 RepID=UPI002DBBF3FB|nr:family 20 glycosylhydrolase [Streptomyces sp. H27-D2]MEC4015941.1 family 20 glycosylhydrolase [Streptomyces sp. H27-D2]
MRADRPRREGGLPAGLSVRGLTTSATVVALLVFTGCSDGSQAHPPDTRGSDARSPDAQSPAAQSPDGRGGQGSGSGRTASAPKPAFPAAPRTIPSVRAFAPAPADTWSGGAEWRPAAGTRVIADPDGPLADEARLLAKELDAGHAAGPAERGDVQLAIDPGRSGGREAYELTVRDGTVRITGSDQAGVFYGTRTVLQAVRADGKLRAGTIRDRPDRPQRGLSLDIARKHFTAGWIEARVREMADLKLNQLQLHFSDDQGFRLESSSHPEIVSEQHLSKAELRRIVSLARGLHIAVIPEIDSPGHLGAVIRAHPRLQLKNTSGSAVRGAVDIARPEAARIVDDLLREYAPLFPGLPGQEAYGHLGGDEYQALTVKNPEASFPRLAAAARAKYGPKAKVQDLATGWLNDRSDVLRKLDRRPKAWNDGFFRGGVVAAHRDREVEYWTGKELGAREPQEYLREGRKVVNLNDAYLYYVLGEPNTFRYPTGERIYRQWTPAVLRGSKPVPASMAGPDRVLGGRFAVWCDIAGAQTQDQVTRGIRMPLRALAQKLWEPGEPALSWSEFTGLARATERG